MRIRFFILSILILAYGIILGHEVVFGHHLSSVTAYHHNHSDAAHHHDGNCKHLPCLMDMNPHFVISDPDTNQDLEGNDPFNPDFIFDFDLISIRLTCVSNHLILSGTESKSPCSPYIQSLRLRGPPLG